MKKMFSVLLTVLFLCGLPAAADAKAKRPHPVDLLPPTEQQAHPLRIACLPIRGLDWLGDAGQRYLVADLRRILHIPLNSTLGYAEYLDGQKALQELTHMTGDARYADKKGRFKIKLAMADLADRIGADLVIFLSVDNAYEYIFYRWEDIVVNAGAELTLYGFDRRTGETIAENMSRGDVGTYPMVNRNDLAIECWEHVSHAVKLRERIYKPAPSAPPVTPAPADGKTSDKPTEATPKPAPTTTATDAPAQTATPA